MSIHWPRERISSAGLLEFVMATVASQAVILLLAGAVRTGDELERGVQLEGLAWSYPVVLRAERGWSQAELARRLCVSGQTVNAIENGRYDPSLPLPFTIGRLFESSIENIFSPDTVEVGQAQA